MKTSVKKDYPFIHKYKIPIVDSKYTYQGEEYTKVYCPFKELDKRLKELKISILFHELFGVQTSYVEGLYPWDVEAVLCRIFSRKLTGTQLIWD